MLQFLGFTITCTRIKSQATKLSDLVIYLLLSFSCMLLIGISGSYVVLSQKRKCLNLKMPEFILGNKQSLVSETVLFTNIVCCMIMWYYNTYANIQVLYWYICQGLTLPTLLGSALGSEGHQSCPSPGCENTPQWCCLVCV